jgi:ComF family protein
MTHWITTCRQWGTDLLHIFYPHLCAGCRRDMPALSQCFCLHCRQKLESVAHTNSRDNDFTDRFWGRLPLENGAAMYYFAKRSPIQRALFALKYYNQPDIGVRLGRDLGRQLYQRPAFRDIDGIVPVPLHPRKERKRGYNQSAMLAEGLAEFLAVPVIDGALVRQQHNESQTRKKRLERFNNVGEVFAVHNPAAVRGKHLLLVDDVLTTGATLEACGLKLLEVPGVRISVATIAMARR